VTTRDWVAWHAAYDEDSPLQHRLRAVQRRIRDALDEWPVGAIRVVDFMWSVGVHRYGGDPVPLVAGRRLFTFLPSADG